LIYLEAFVPREEQCLFASTVVFNVALAANEAAHFLTACIDVWIVVTLALSLTPALDARQMGNAIIAFCQSCNSDNETRARNANLHCVGVVAVDATDGVGVVSFRSAFMLLF